MNDQSHASSFTQAACPQQEVTLLLDKDVLDSINGEYTDWQRHIRELLRYYHDTNQIREAAFNPDAFEPGEMAQPDPPRPA